jgi:hypothetical protein
MHRLSTPLEYWTVSPVKSEHPLWREITLGRLGTQRGNGIESDTIWTWTPNSSYGKQDAAPD